MKLDFIILARGSAIDEASNLLSIFEIINEVNADARLFENAGASLSLVVVANISREEKDGQDFLEENLSLKILKPNGQQDNLEIPIAFESQHMNFRLRINLNLGLTGPGRYQFKMSNSSQELGSTYLEVKPV